MKFSLLANAAVAFCFSTHVHAAELTTFAAAEKEALRLYGTPEGHAYMVKFLDSMDQAVGQAIHACMPGIPGRKKDIRYQIVFIVSIDGRIERMLRSSDNPVAVCFTKSIRPPAKVPRPPHDHWPIVSVIVHGP
jgi:hypothetical protein